MKAVGIFSAAINLLTLTGSFYMLQVYDRVLVSRSVETLVLLSAISLLAFALQGSLDSIRNRMMNRIGAQIDQDLSPLAFRVSTTLPLHGANATEAMQPLRDVDQLRAFLGSTGPTAFFDLPFMPIFIFGCFLLHPWLGWFPVMVGSNPGPWSDTSTDRTPFCTTALTSCALACACLNALFSPS